MASSAKPGSFEDFVRWLGEPPRTLDTPEPSASVLDAARAAWREARSVDRAHRAALAERVRAGGYCEELELLAAADSDPKRWLPRLRTPNGFVVSALYTGDSAPGAAPVGVLVECPESLIETCRGLKVRILCGGQWVELGEIDVDGRAMGDLPGGLEFKPPLGLRVGEVEERPARVPDPGARR